jgi:hypothetical protein
VLVERGMTWFYRQYQREQSPNDRRLRVWCLENGKWKRVCLSTPSASVGWVAFKPKKAPATGMAADAFEIESPRTLGIAMK